MATADLHEVFGISAVSNLTGISTHTLRVWERRYGVVEPDRSDSKRREYTRDEIQRLTLIKTLVDHGHAIRNIAKLTMEQLEERIRETTESRLGNAASDHSLCRVALAGEFSRDALRDAAEESDAIKLLGEFKDLDELADSLKPGSIDLIVVELPCLFPDAVDEVQTIIGQVNARRAIIVYRFAASETIGPLDKDFPSITTMRAPVDAMELGLACLTDIMTPEEAGIPELPEAEGDIPRRKFSESELAKIARSSSVVQCECPRHLANLLSSLNAFEAYSAACENRNDEDAKLHAYLHRATADCRSRMEEALGHLLKAEDIEIR